MRVPWFAAGAAIVLLLTGTPATSKPSAASRQPRLLGFRVDNGATPFAGDNGLLTTISPNGDGFRDAALVHFRLRRAAKLTMTVLWTRFRHRTRPALIRQYVLGGGAQTLVWRPAARQRLRTYLLRVAGRTAVVRVQGVDAAVRRESYRPGATVTVSVSTDARALRAVVLRAGDPDWASNPVDLAAGSNRRPFRIRLVLGDWPTGVYLVRLTADDGRVGYAPFVLRPRRFGRHRVAVVMPTYSWQAYNFQDVDGDGYGDTWYDRWRKGVQLGRHYLGIGLPPNFYEYDLQFLRWLVRHGHDVDYLADGDLEGFSSGGSLARLYDLIVFPGHHEYVTAREYRLVRTYRNLGGHLMFLSANNFGWKIRKTGMRLRRVRQWRNTRYPEASLIGVQYCCNNDAHHRGRWVVRNAERAPWLWDGTGLGDGSRFGDGGIEIDHRTAWSPSNTSVLAEIPHVIGKHSAQMTYYETRRGAEVFAAGAFTLAGEAMAPTVSRLLENLWEHMTATADKPPARARRGFGG